MEHPDLSGKSKNQSYKTKIPIYRKYKEIHNIELCATLCLCDFVATYFFT